MAQADKKAPAAQGEVDETQRKLDDLQKQEERLTTLKSQLVAQQNKEIANFGDGAVFVNRTANGFVQSYYKDVRLKEGIHFYKIGRKPDTYEGGKKIKGGPNFTIGGEGYTRLNQVANVSLLKPLSITAFGQERPNPYTEMNAHGHISQVAVRVFGIGYAPTGNLMVTDKTLSYNLETYFLQDLQAKIKKHPACGTLGLKNKEPTKWTGKLTTGWGDNATTKDVETEVTDATILYFQPIDDIGDTVIGLWVDMAHPDIIAAWNEKTRRRLMADRSCETMSSNRALKAHPSIGVSDLSQCYDPTTKTAMVRVYGHTHSLSRPDMAGIASALEGGDLDKAGEIAGGSITVLENEGEEKVTDEELGFATDEAEAFDEASHKKKAKAEPNPQEKKKAPPSAKPKAEPKPKTESKPNAEPPEQVLGFCALLAEKAVSGELQPYLIVNKAKDLGFNVAVYSELTEDQAAAVLDSFEKDA